MQAFFVVPFFNFYFLLLLLLSMKSITFIQPDDWHIHLREEAALSNTVETAVQHFGRILVMPNLKKPLTQVSDIMNYRKDILSIVEKCNPAHHFTPWMTLYLTDKTQPETMIEAKKTGCILGAKLYPAGATTHSQSGVNFIQTLYPVFEAMQQQELVLHIHGEVTRSSCDIFLREKYFILEILAPLIRNFPKLKITLEHISTKFAVEFITQAPDTIAATITPHHLWLNRNDLLAGGIKPHYYCLPILKKRSDQTALIKAAVSGHPRFFMGTDSAPHAIHQKESACGCAGVYNAPVAVPLCAMIFEKANALDKLENFTSRFGAEFYDLPINKKWITLTQQPFSVPERLPLGEQWVIPLGAGKTLSWKMEI